MKPRHGENLILLGDKAESAKHVPTVRAKAEDVARRLVKGASLVQRVLLPNGWAKIMVRENHRKIVIYTENAPITYEFWTSALISAGYTHGTPPFIDPDNPNLGIIVCGRGSLHEFKGTSRKSRPLVAMCEDCDPEGEPPENPWNTYVCNDFSGLNTDMYTPYIWGQSKTYQHLWWKHNKGDTFVLSECHIAPGYSNMCLDSRYNGDLILLEKSFITEPGGGQPFVYKGYSRLPFSVGVPAFGEGQYARSACCQTVNGELFTILADNQGNFHFWKAGQYTNVPANEIKSVIPDYPDWAKWNFDNWEFNSDGTRGVLCPLNYVPSTPDVNGQTIYKEGTVGAGRVNEAYPDKFEATEDIPGIIEVGIRIEMDEDGYWSPYVDILREEEFSESEHFFLHAAYLVGDDRLPYPKDTLVGLCFDLWIIEGDLFYTVHNPPDYYPDNIATRIRTALYTVALVDGHWVEIDRYPCYYDVNVASIIANYTDGLGNPIEVLRATGGGHFITYSKAYAVNLRTLSMWRVLEAEEYVGDPLVKLNSYGYEVWAYRELVERKEHIPELGPLLVVEWDTEGYERLGVEGYPELWSVFARAAFTPASEMQFNWHPNGHWSLASPLYPRPIEDDVLDEGPPVVWEEKERWMVDIVNIRQSGADVRMTHKDLYNAAFGDDRDDDYYLDWEYPLGQYRTAGFWRHNK